MYILIENPGEAYTESFTTLGVSTARGDDSKIGQFGSGAKMSVLLLLRIGANPVIFTGNTKIEFSTKPAIMGSKAYHQVMVKVGTSKPRELGFALEYGELDWNDPWMALREFISNAIDASSFDEVSISVKDNVRAKAGYTRVFIEATPEILKAYNLCSERFLHFSYKDTVKILEKNEVSPCKVYRRGVYIRTLTQNSLFDYNSDDLRVDECRNCDNWNAFFHIKQYTMRNLGVNHWEKILKDVSCREGNNNLETETSGIVPEYNNLRIAYKNLYGEAPICTTEVYNSVRNKNGFYVCNGFLFEALKKVGIKTHEEYLSKIELDGNSVIEPTPLMVDTFNRCCQFLAESGISFSKPNLMGFHSISENGEIKAGYYSDNTVYVNVNRETSKDVILEELAHHITGSCDNSYDMQRFGIELAARLMDFFV